MLQFATRSTTPTSYARSRNFVRRRAPCAAAAPPLGARTTRGVEVCAPRAARRTSRHRRRRRRRARGAAFSARGAWWSPAVNPPPPAAPAGEAHLPARREDARRGSQGRPRRARRAALDAIELGPLSTDVRGELVSGARVDGAPLRRRARRSIGWRASVESRGRARAARRVPCAGRRSRGRVPSTCPRRRRRHRDASEMASSPRVPRARLSPTACRRASRERGAPGCRASA